MTVISAINGRLPIMLLICHSLFGMGKVYLHSGLSHDFSSCAYRPKCKAEKVEMVENVSALPGIKNAK